MHICAVQLMELLNSKKEELQRLAEQLKNVQIAPADEQEARTACTAALKCVQHPHFIATSSIVLLQ